MNADVDAVDCPQRGDIRFAFQAVGEDRGRGDDTRLGGLDDPSTDRREVTEIVCIDDEVATTVDTIRRTIGIGAVLHA